MEIAILVSDHEEWLPGISDVHLIGFGEVISDADLLATVLKSHFNWVRTEIDISNNIGPLVTPVSNDGVTGEGGLDRGLPIVLVREVLLHILHLREARFVAHELVDAIDAEHATELGLDRSRFESTPNLEVRSLDDKRV